MSYLFDKAGDRKKYGETVPDQLRRFSQALRDMGIQGPSGIDEAMLNDAADELEQLRRSEATWRAQRDACAEEYDRLRAGMVASGDDSN